MLSFRSLSEGLAKSPMNVDFAAPDGSITPI